MNYAIDNAAWEQAKAEIVSEYPQDTDSGRDIPTEFMSLIAQRAQSIKDAHNLTLKRLGLK